MMGARRWILSGGIIGILFALFICILGCPAQAGTIRCASTTSTQNSGLFDYLLPLFEKETGIEVQVIAVGTGAALGLGRSGDVDLVLVHAKDAELKMVEEGWFVNRRNVMYNDFVIVGPMTDSAEVGRAATARESFARIRTKRAFFISRGDDSGTHKKEFAIWNDNGFVPDPKHDRWYLSVGQGMAKTLRIASEKRAYTLTDRGTWLALKDKKRLELALVFEGDPILFNQYGAMAVNPARHRHTKYDTAMVFINWLTSETGQKLISSFRDAGGNKLFIPNAQ